MNGEGRLSSRPFSFVELLASAMMHLPDNVGHKTNPPQVNLHVIQCVWGWWNWLKITVK
jgi:hypothetical protein